MVSLPLFEDNGQSYIVSRETSMRPQKLAKGYEGIEAFDRFDTLRLDQSIKYSGSHYPAKRTRSIFRVASLVKNNSNKKLAKGRSRKRKVPLIAFSKEIHKKSYLKDDPVIEAINRKNEKEISITSRW